MKIFLLVVLIFWAGMGVRILKNEMEEGNQKLLNANAKGWPKILLKSLFYGPYTRSNVLAKL